MVSLFVEGRHSVMLKATLSRPTIIMEADSTLAHQLVRSTAESCPAVRNMGGESPARECLRIAFCPAMRPKARVVVLPTTPALSTA